MALYTTIKSVIVHRADQTITPPIGYTFDYTDVEVQSYLALGYIRLPVAGDPPFPADSSASSLTVPNNFADASCLVTTAGVDILPFTPRKRLVWRNTDLITPGFTAGGVVVWLRWGTKALFPAAVGGLGSFAILAGDAHEETYAVNQGALNGIAESGAGVHFQVEVYS
ncbi:MAG: hypothetical protein ACRYGR_09405 [Janthinobacterium lividum]